MIKIGIFGTCRIDDYNFDNLVKLTNNYPYQYKDNNNNMTINVRPLGYTTTASDVLQNLMLIKNNKYKEISDKFIFNNIFLKHGGKSYIQDINYDYLVIEICSLKKIIHKSTNFIFPYEIEGPHNKSDFFVLREDEKETIENIKKIRDLINCKIVLLPPIINFNCNVEKGVHEDVTLDKVLNYRKEILNRLKKVEDNENIYLLDWNELIIKEGVDKMLIDQFHFSDYGKKYISKSIINKISLIDIRNNCNEMNNNNIILKLKTLKYYYLTIPQNKNRIENIEKTFKDLDLAKIYSVVSNNLSKFQSGASGFLKMIDIAVKDQNENKFVPFGLLEDDVSKYREFPDNIEIPNNTDILYIGTSTYGYNHSIKWGSNFNVYTESINDRTDIYKINNMLSTHGFIIISKRGLEYCKKCMNISIQKNIPYDNYFAGLQSHYNVYCLKTPLVYQDAKIGGGENAKRAEEATKRELNLNLLNKKIPNNYVIN